MGEIAEDMIDGTCCSLCGCYFASPAITDENGEPTETYTHGYPVYCWDCWDKKCGHQRADVATF